jgi:hypothetical protein
MSPARKATNISSSASVKNNPRERSTPAARDHSVCIRPSPLPPDAAAAAFPSICRDERDVATTLNETKLVRFKLSS